MSDKRGERAKKFAEMHLRARDRGGRSQEFMAMELKVSANTIKNWEKGVSAPSFFQSRQWFSVLHINPVPYYLKYLSPYIANSIKDSEDENKVKEYFRVLNDELPLQHKQALLYLCKGDHGCEASEALQLMIAYLHLPLRSRIIPALSIELRYEMDKEADEIICKKDILPNMKELKESLLRARLSVMNHEYGYTVIGEQDNVDTDREALEISQFAQIHLEARNRAGLSQEDMALELNVSKNTIKNWEKGVSTPTFLESLEWFRAVDESPLQEYLKFLSPYKRTQIISVDKEEAINKEFSELENVLTLDDMRAILYLYHGQHGSSPSAVLQLFLAYFHTPYKNRLIAGITISHMYDLESELDNIVCKDDILPDKEMLRRSVMMGRASVLRDDYGYTIIGTEVNEEILDTIREGKMEEGLKEIIV